MRTCRNFVTLFYFWQDTLSWSWISCLFLKTFPTHPHNFKLLDDKKHRNHDSTQKQRYLDEGESSSTEKIEVFKLKCDRQSFNPLTTVIPSELKTRLYIRQSQTSESHDHTIFNMILWVLRVHSDHLLTYCQSIFSGLFFITMQF